MRRAAVLLLALAAAIAGDESASARPPPRRHITPPSIEVKPEVSASTESAIALQTPGADRILIRAGTFMMGSDEVENALSEASCRQEQRGPECKPKGSPPKCVCDDVFANEYPAHEVYLSDYWIDRTEVTVASYERCVDAGRCREPPFASGGRRFMRPDYPVTLVAWNDATAFCDWNGERLPTEAEWERAARGPKGRRYPWGMVYNGFLANHGAFAYEELDDRDGFLELAPVGSFPDGKTPDGILDLAGNVEEWVADWYLQEYPKESLMNPKGPDSGDDRVVRGGSFGHGRAWLRGAYRGYDRPSARRMFRGFRCAKNR